MDILKWEIFRSSTFKQIKFLFSSPRRAQKVLLVSETGILSLETFPMATGWMSWAENKMTWLVDHRLKMSLEGQDSPVQLVSERSYLPLDPFELFGLEERKAFTPLAEIALLKHAEKRTVVGEENKSSAKNNLYKTVIIGCFVLLALVIVVALVK